MSTLCLGTNTFDCPRKNSGSELQGIIGCDKVPWDEIDRGTIDKDTAV